MSEIILGDCISEMKKLPDESFDCILADPPYFACVKDDWDNQWKNIDEYVEWSKQWIDQAIRCLKPSGNMFIYGISHILARISVLLDIDKQHWLCWSYKNKAVARSKFWISSHESIINFWKDKEQRIFNLDSVRIPYSDSFIRNSQGHTRKATLGRYSKGNKETIYKANPGGAMPRTVLFENDLIQLPALAGGAGKVERVFYSISKDETFPNTEISNYPKEDIIQHSTQKPLRLSCHLLTSCMPKEGGKVLIPFSGSGSECLATAMLNMDYTAFDTNPLYVKMGQSLLKKYNEFKESKS